MSETKRTHERRKQQVADKDIHSGAPTEVFSNSVMVVYLDKTETKSMCYGLLTFQVSHVLYPVAMVFKKQGLLLVASGYGVWSCPETIEQHIIVTCLSTFMFWVSSMLQSRYSLVPSRAEKCG